MFERPPPRLDHGVREPQFRKGQHTAQNTGDDQFVDLGVHVLNPGIRQYDRGVTVGVSAALRQAAAASRTRSTAFEAAVVNSAGFHPRPEETACLSFVGAVARFRRP